MSLLILASFVFGLYTANLFAVTQTLAGVAAAGNLAGIVAPVVTGFIVERTLGFYFAFV
jgi:ACS family D-galactonate transporter-like MFS transporter